MSPHLSKCHIVGNHMSRLIWSDFINIHTLCMKSSKALARLHIYAGSSLPSLHAYAISILILCTGSNSTTLNLIHFLKSVSFCFKILSICFSSAKNHILFYLSQLILLIFNFVIYRYFVFYRSLIYYIFLILF